MATWAIALEKLFLALFLFSLLIPLSKPLFSYEWSRVYVFDCLLFPLIFLWIARLFLLKEIPHSFFKSFDLLLLFFLIWLFLCNAMGVRPDVSYGAWALFLRSFLIYFYVSHNIGKTISLKQVMTVLFLLLLMESFLAHIQYFGNTNFGKINNYLGVQERIFDFGSGKTIRVPGTFINTNILAGWLVYLMVMVFAWCKDLAYWQKRIILFSGNILAAFALFVTFSRVKIIALFLGIGLLVWWHRKSLGAFVFKRKKSVLGCALIVLVLLGFIPGHSGFKHKFSKRFEAVVTLNAKGFEWKALQRRLAFQLMLSNPFTGVGQRNFDAVIDRNDYPYGNFKDGRLACHNIPLMVGAESGVIGFVLFCSIFVYLLVLFFKRMRRPPRDEVEAVQGGALICCAVMVFDMQFNTVLFHHSFMPLFFIIIGLATMRAAPSIKDGFVKSPISLLRCISRHVTYD